MEKRASRKDGRGARPGERRGGRPKGTPNKRTAALRKAIETFAIAGEQPQEVMLSVMRNPDLPPMLRFDAACKAAPYVHPKLAAVQHGGKVDLGLGARLDAAIKRVNEQEARVNGKRPSAWTSASMIDSPQFGSFAATPMPPGTLPSPHRGYRPRRRSGRPSAPGRAIRPRALPRPLGRGSLPVSRVAQCPLTNTSSCL
jgi:hypothetical protein